ncbi:MAG: flagellar hook-associated protein FlgK [Candidatus Nanopelagicales bacterium]
MSGSFATISTALTALQTSRVALDVAAGNVANANTDGYVRRRVETESVGAPARPAMWSRVEAAGSGVRVAGLTRMSDAFLDTRARQEHGVQSYLDVRHEVLSRMETALGEPGDNGVTAELSGFRQAWHDLANNPTGGAARSQVLARAESVARAFAGQARSVATEASGQRSRAQSIVAEANTLATGLASMNEAIASADLTGADASDLLDRRDVMAMRLAELTGAKVTIGTRGTAEAALNGVALVAGNAAGRLEIAGGIAADGSADGAPVSFSVATPGGPGATNPGPLGGELGATAELLNTTMPGYLANLSQAARTLADTVNAQHVLGFDLTGTPGAAMFSYDPGNVAGTLALALSDPDQVAASALPGGVLDVSNAQLLGATNPAQGDYQRLVSAMGTEVLLAGRLSAGQRAVTNQVDGSREQLSGVSLDEETVTLLAHQRAYEAAARVLTTVDSMLDTLINRTGITR